MDTLRLYVDGGCSGNGQKDLTKRQMVSVVTDEQGTVLSERLETGGSNNIAELIAVRDALKMALSAGIETVHVLTDSRNNLAWTFGRKVGNGINDRPRVMSLRAEIAQMRERLSFEMTWVPRGENIAGHYIEKRYSL